MGTEDVVYRIDATDAIVWVNRAWLPFAAANASEDLYPEDVLGQSLWSFISDPDTAHIYRTLLARVRSGGGILSLPFRCDAPHERRYMELSISTPEPDIVEFRSHLVKSEPRSYMPALDATIEHSRRWIKMCAWCKRVQLDHGEWLEIELAVAREPLLAEDHPPRVSHGMCVDCYAHKLAEIRRRTIVRRHEDTQRPAASILQ